MGAVIVLWVVIGLLGAQRFDGEWGVTGMHVSCESVWHLPWQGDLNAYTCQDELRDRVDLVGVLACIAVVATAALVSRSRRVWMAGAVIGIVVATALIYVGRHLIWSINSQ